MTTQQLVDAHSTKWRKYPTRNAAFVPARNGKEDEESAVSGETMRRASLLREACTQWGE